MCSHRRSYTIASEHTFVNGAQKNPNKGLHFYRTYVTIVSVKDYYKTEGGTFMAQDKLTAKQQEILEYIKSQILQRGFPPAVREICEAVNLKSTSSVHSHLETLEKNGYIRRDSKFWTICST